MNRDSKANMYDELLHHGDIINHRISDIKSSVNMTPEETVELSRLNMELQLLEDKLNKLLSNN